APCHANVTKEPPGSAWRTWQPSPKLSPIFPDLLIAATAELAQLVVLHHDKDSELIAEVAGRPIERLIAN
ncbi:MAG: hypothetical protein J2O38_05885, partial [Acidimicrobiales bacterium]|nr:hypothetical protein [Acidimicrobiales bacterium]